MDYLLAFLATTALGLTYTAGFLRGYRIGRSERLEIATRLNAWL